MATSFILPWFSRSPGNPWSPVLKQCWVSHWTPCAWWRRGRILRVGSHTRTILQRHKGTVQARSSRIKSVSRGHSNALDSGTEIFSVQKNIRGGFKILNFRPLPHRNWTAKTQLTMQWKGSYAKNNRSAGKTVENQDSGRTCWSPTRRPAN